MYFATNFNMEKEYIFKKAFENTGIKGEIRKIAYIYDSQTKLPEHYSAYVENRSDASKLFDETFKLEIGDQIKAMGKQNEKFLIIKSKIEFVRLFGIYGLLPLGFKYCWFVPYGELKDFHPAPYFYDVYCGYIVYTMKRRY